MRTRFLTSLAFLCIAGISVTACTQSNDAGRAPSASTSPAAKAAEDRNAGLLLSTKACFTVTDPAIQLDVTYAFAKKTSNAGVVMQGVTSCGEGSGNSTKDDLKGELMVSRTSDGDTTAVKYRFMGTNPAITAPVFNLFDVSNRGFCGMWMVGMTRQVDDGLTHFTITRQPDDGTKSFMIDVSASTGPVTMNQCSAPKN